MRRRTTLFLSIAGLLLLAASAAAQTTTSTDVDLTGITITNPCNGEAVILNGTEHIVTRTLADSSGGLHLSIHNNAQGITGTGQTTGAIYHFQSISEFDFNAKPPFPSEFSFPATLKVTGQGTVPNFTSE